MILAIVLSRGKTHEIFFLILLLFTSICFANDLSDVLQHADHSTQLILVLSENNQATQALLQRFERKNNHASWQKVGVPFEVILGSKGLAWDQNFFKFIGQQDAVKQEGDRHSPMGVFALGSVFAKQPLKTNMSFFQLQEDTVCVDDEHSRYYNKIVVNSDQIKQDWNSGEQMDDYAEYDRGIAVQYNTIQRPHAGSCIFIHIKIKPVTTGCTSMPKENIVTLINWLNAKRYPVLVQVSQADMKKLQPMLKQYFKFG